jgi:hypothetical protein
MRRSILVLITTLLVAACASSGSSRTPANVDQTARSSYLLTREEIAAHGDLQTAMDLVRRLRPTFRGTVYLDGVKYGAFSSLINLSSGSIREIRQLSEGDAALRFGTGAGWVILVTSR